MADEEDQGWLDDETDPFDEPAPTEEAPTLDEEQPTSQAETDDEEAEAHEAEAEEDAEAGHEIEAERRERLESSLLVVCELQIVGTTVFSRSVWCFAGCSRTTTARTWPAFRPHCFAKEHCSIPTCRLKHEVAFSTYMFS